MKFFLPNKGWGFATVKGRPDVFIHKSVLTSFNHAMDLKGGETISGTVKMGAGGRFEFTSVDFLGPSSNERANGAKGDPSVSSPLKPSGPPFVGQGKIKWVAEEGYAIVALPGKVEVFVPKIKIDQISTPLRRGRPVRVHYGEKAPGKKYPTATSIALI